MIFYRKIIKLEYNLFHNYLWIDKFGVIFLYNGDEVTWLFPWQRTHGKNWLSTNAEGEFNNLKEIDKFWNEYWQAECKKLDEEFLNK
jgi:hypothetical protein